MAVAVVPEPVIVTTDPPIPPPVSLKVVGDGYISTAVFEGLVNVGAGEVVVYARK